MAGRIDVVIGIVVRAGKVLVSQRPRGTTFPDHWEFPGGKRDAGESLEQCLARELREELDVEVTPITTLRPIDHDYPAASIRLHPYLCTTAGEPRPLAFQRLDWVHPSALRELRFPPANDRLIEEVIAHLAAPRAGDVAGVDFAPTVRKVHSMGD